MEEQIPFKNLHSREYSGHKKKVSSCLLSLPFSSMVNTFKVQNFLRYVVVEFAKSKPSLNLSVSILILGVFVSLSKRFTLWPGIALVQKLASGSVDQTARIWHIEPHGHGKVKDIELKGHTDSVDQLCWDPKHADLIATASGDKTVRLWDARNGKCSQQAELSGENINITYKPDGTHVAVGNRDDELTILDVRKFKPIHRRKFNYEVNEIAWNMTGEMFFLTTGNGEGTVEVLSYPSLRPLDTLMAHTAGCYCIAIDPIGRYFAVGSADSLVSLWDISEMLCVRTFTKLEAAMNSVEWNPKYNLLAYAGDDKNKYQADEAKQTKGLKKNETYLVVSESYWLQGEPDGRT
ncbi:WD40/YVTN repeat-like-containing domain superfamily [Sesbania bispinosa]|nr:WD40/YVTN repeat-like-containing domain superfamily [Sesbania bispinosa]